MADKVLTDEESIILIKFIEHVIFDVLVMERMRIYKDFTFFCMCNTTQNYFQRYKKVYMCFLNLCL